MTEPERIQPLFHRWLYETRKLQRDAYGLDYSRFDNPAALVAYIKDMHIATIAEMQEALDETTWKPWASDEPYVDRTLVVKELIDALHFIGNILAAVGCTDDELDLRYRQKMEVNRERQLRAGGYRVRGETADKCRNCRRALDDVAPSFDDPTICQLCMNALAVVTEGVSSD